MYKHGRSLVQRLAGKPFALLGVNSDEDRELVRKVVEEERITWRSFWDGSEGPISARWNIRKWPSIFVLDAEGRIRFKDLHSGALDEAIDGLLRETDPAKK